MSAEIEARIEREQKRDFFGTVISPHGKQTNGEVYLEDLDVKLTATRYVCHHLLNYPD